MSRFLAGTEIEQVKTAYWSPWQNPFVERFRGTLRRELLDNVMILSEGHLKRLLKVGSPARPPELQNSSFACAHGLIVVLNGYPKISLPWGFSGGHDDILAQHLWGEVRV